MGKLRNLRLPNDLLCFNKKIEAAGGQCDDQKKNDGHHAVVSLDSLSVTIEMFAPESKP